LGVNINDNIIKSFLVLLAYICVSILIILPIALIFKEAFSFGVRGFITAITTYEAKEAIKLSLLVCFICLPINVIFGLTAAWSISKFNFFGKNILLTLIEIPFSVSPVISGLLYILLYGNSTKFGRFLLENDIQIVFSLPGIVLVTLFVTFPFIVRELIPLMIEQGKEQEEAATLLGAKGYQVFWNITLPNIRWALLYGILLSNARALGEYGAVSVISGHIKGLTNTMPLYVETLYNEYNAQSSYAVSVVLATFAIITIFLQSLVESFYYSRVTNKEKLCL
jgi:sulfate transport system permease protein